MQHPPSARAYANCNYLTGLVNTVLVRSLMNFQQPALEILFTCSNLILILSKLLSVETYVFTSTEMDRGCSLWAQISQTGHIQAVILTKLCTLPPKTLRSLYTVKLVRLHLTLSVCATRSDGATTEAGGWFGTATEGSMLLHDLLITL